MVASDTQDHGIRHHFLLETVQPLQKKKPFKLWLLSLVAKSPSHLMFMLPFTVMSPLFIVMVFMV